VGQLVKVKPNQAKTQVRESAPQSPPATGGIDPDFEFFQRAVGSLSGIFKAHEQNPTDP
jgi:hypothetical protein